MIVCYNGGMSENTTTYRNGTVSLRPKQVYLLNVLLTEYIEDKMPDEALARELRSLIRAGELQRVLWTTRKAKPGNPTVSTRPRGGHARS